MQLYDFIDKRRSVRHYTAKLTEEIRNKLNNFVENEITPLYADIGYEIRIVNQEKISSRKVASPEYILFFSEDKEGRDINAGFILQQIDLFLQSLGAGSCWLGLATTEEKSSKGDYVIMLAAGMTDKPLRKGKEDFVRKPLPEVGDIKDGFLLEAVRLAPSSVNSQPWYYKEREKDIIDVFMDENLLYKVILRRFNKIDIGISLCHLNEALKKQGRKFEIIPGGKGFKKSLISLKLI
jgi:nitroreductase